MLDEVERQRRRDEVLSGSPCLPRVGEVDHRPGELGLLMNHVDERHQHATDLLTAALSVAPGEKFSHAGRRYQRKTTNYDRRLERVTGISPRTRP